MADPLCYFVKSTHANYWFNVERGVWVVREDATRFSSKSMAFSVAKMLRREERGPSSHRIYVAAVRKRSELDALRELSEAFQKYVDAEGDVQTVSSWAVLLRLHKKARAMLPSSNPEDAKR